MHLCGTRVRDMSTSSPNHQRLSFSLSPFSFFFLLSPSPSNKPTFLHNHIPIFFTRGNPIFFVDKNQIFCCGLDLSDFFKRVSLFQSFESLDPQILKRQRFVSEKSADSSSNFSRRSLNQGGSTGARTPRWIEF